MLSDRNDVPHGQKNPPQPHEAEASPCLSFGSCAAVIAGDRRCALRAGTGTDHRGVGPCWLHGGRDWRPAGSTEQLLRSATETLAAAVEAAKEVRELSFAEIAALSPAQIAELSRDDRRRRSKR